MTQRNIRASLNRSLILGWRGLRSKFTWRHLWTTPKKQRERPTSGNCPTYFLRHSIFGTTFANFSAFLANLLHFLPFSTFCSFSSLIPVQSFGLFVVVFDGHSPIQFCICWKTQKSAQIVLYYYKNGYWLSSF